MPLYSKPVSGRIKKFPNVLTSIPYQKKPNQTWTPIASPKTPERANRQVDASSNDSHSSTVNQHETSPIKSKTSSSVRFSDENVKIHMLDDNAWSSDNGTDYEYHSSRSILRNKPKIVSMKLSGLSGAQALQQCEEHTDWFNEVLTRNHLPLISDLRKSIGDGFTLPAILEIITGVSLSCVKASPKTKEDKTQNISHCLTFLNKRGVDTTGIESAEIEDGNLKSVLNLTEKIKGHFKQTYRPELNGHNHYVDVTIPEAQEEIDHSPTMPGAMKLPGAVMTPFQISINTNRTNLPDSQSRKVGFHEDETIPGALGRDLKPADTSKPHSTIISTTEISTNGVAQHGVEERKAQLTNNQSRGMFPRHPNARSIVPNAMQENKSGPPTHTQRAWTESMKPQEYNMNGGSNGQSVEDRLRSLITNNQGKPPISNNIFPTSRQSSWQQGYTGGDSLFHGGGSEVFDDGEILVVPPPRLNGSHDFEATLSGDYSYGPGYRHLANQQSGQQSHGYVPSKPTEKWNGARGEAILIRSQPKVAFRSSPPQKSVSPNVPSVATFGHDNQAYTHDSTVSGNYGGREENSIILANKPPNPPKTGSNEMRNAWKKLYGPQAQLYTDGVAGIKRGDNLRSSYGPYSPQRSQQNSNQNSVKYSASPLQNISRPVSAPAPAHMQAHFQEHDRLKMGQSVSQDNLDNGQSHVNHRESPMGQSSSTQGHLNDSSSSQQSQISQDKISRPLLHLQSTIDSNVKLSDSLPSSLSQASPSGSLDYAIGPASKYPDNPGSRPSSGKKPIGLNIPSSPSQRNEKHWLPHTANSNRSENKNLHNLSVADKTEHGVNGGKVNTIPKEYNSMHGRRLSMEILDTSLDRSHDMQNESIFDYQPQFNSESSGSITPPLPPLSPSISYPDSPVSDFNLPRSLSATNVSSALNFNEKLEDRLPLRDTRKPRRTSEMNFRMERKHQRHKNISMANRAKSAGLNDVKESDTDTESNLSFDIDDTILTVESHDTEQPHPAGNLLNSMETNALRQQLHNLENKYHDLQSTVPPDQSKDHFCLPHMPYGKNQNPGLGPPPIGRPRRWSIGSSDTSSFRRESKFKPAKHTLHKHRSKEFRNISKRFQKLESHVVTLARSVAHLSSELRTHNVMVNDLEAVKRELREFKDNPSLPFPSMFDHESLREWAPSLINPKRVNKLTKFFGEEPPLMEFFLKRLGYERYVPNFQSEHIGMLELPYMTEDRLEKIGVPMGPRLRILQEAQVAFKQNYNIYIV